MPELAARPRSGGRHATARQALLHCEQLVREGDIEGFYESSFAFFRMGYRFSMNPYIEEMLEDLQPALQRGYYLALHTNKRELQEAYNFFKGVLEAVLLRKGDKAAEFAMRRPAFTVFTTLYTMMNTPTM